VVFSKPPAKTLKSKKFYKTILIFLKFPNMNLDEINRMVNKVTGFSDILTGTNGINTMLQKSLSFSQPITGMDLLRSQTNSNFAIGSTNWIEKNSSLHQMAMPNNIFHVSKNLNQVMAQASAQNLGQQTISKSLTQGASSLIGNNSFNKLLTTQNNVMNRLIDLGPNGFNVTQYRNVFNTLGSLSARTALTGILSPLSATTSSYLEKIANDTDDITNTVAKHQYVSASDLNKIYNLIDSLNSKIGSIDKSEFRTFGFWLALISLFLSAFPLIQQNIDASDPGTAPATQQQIIDLRNNLLTAYHNNVNLYAPIRVTDRRCNLRLKPRLKSHRLMTVLPNEKLSVINSKGKWVMVTCLDKDSLPVTGWVLKKYLLKK
jgi:hypothetical protein